jgi:ADP-ribosyl-[dinitrogen reductase] hydrolase
MHSRQRSRRIRLQPERVPSVEPFPAATLTAPPLVNSYWVVPGRLLAGEHPAGLTPELTRARLGKLLETGIDCFVDLTRPEEAMAYRDTLPPGTAYFSRPIPDHAVPSEPAHMQAILAYVREALESGRRVYLHCRAGIGRTGTVVGCLLAEQVGGEEALAHLNRLWRQSGRAAQWSTVPETPEQTEYVRAWERAPEHDPLLQPDTLAAARGLRERFHGALLGLAIGDALAAATQFGRPGRFAPVGDMVGGGPFGLPRGGWSDDTAMTLCLSESLLESDGFDARDQVTRYRRWQQEGHLSATDQCVGITAATSRALALAQWRRQAFSGTHDPQAQDPEPLSRVPAATLYFFARGATVAAEQAAEAARTTCQVPAVLDACRSLAGALHEALRGRPRAAVLAALGATGAPGVPPTPGAAVPPGHTAPAALAAAGDVFGRARNFREAVLAAANLGGNSDVMAAVCGALAGAHYGAGAIPAAWRNGLLKEALIESFADRLLAHALIELGA